MANHFQPQILLLILKFIRFSRLYPRVIHKSPFFYNILWFVTLGGNGVYSHLNSCWHTKRQYNFEVNLLSCWSNLFRSLHFYTLSLNNIIHHNTNALDMIDILIHLVFQPSYILVVLIKLKEYDLQLLHMYVQP